MCEADTVQYLRDLCQEKEYLDTLDGHTVIKTLLEQGEARTMFVVIYKLGEYLLRKLR